MAEHASAKNRPSPQKRHVGRSPGYPSIDLEAALEKARRLHKAEGRNAAHFSTVLEHWGNTAKSGTGRLAFAAVKKFGLINVSGTGAQKSARVSDDCVRIILDDRPGSAERRKLLQVAALRPKIHRELWEAYDGRLPSDTELLFQLKSKHGFTEAGARDFLAQFKKTLAFARVDGSTRIAAAASNDGQEDENGEPDDPDEEDRDDQAPTHKRPDLPRETAKFDRGREPDGQGKEQALPLLSGGTAVLSIPYLLSEEDFEWVKFMLDKLKRGLVLQPPFQAGDLVQWQSQGVDQFTSPRRVVRVQDGYVFVEGSDTGCPLAQVRRA